MPPDGEKPRRGRPRKKEPSAAAPRRAGRKKAASESTVAPSEARPIQAALIDWYRRGHRDLPWRRTSDPYAIWVSEIMLQQTRVETVKERFQEFMRRFPTIEALAAAPLEDVLALWSGLGYYARARNLHAAAREMAERYGGCVPDDEKAVRELPGIGPYTAGAILSIAFRRKAAILDGNVIRVLSRLLTIDEAPDADAAAKRRYWSLSESLLPPAPRAGEPNDVGDFNQALMELGATVCVPQRPVCLVCPVSGFCQARQQGDPERYPPRKEARPVPVVRAVTLVLSRASGELMLLRRPPVGLWGGLWEPPTLPLLPDEREEDGLLRLFGELRGAATPAKAEAAAEAIDRFVKTHARPLPPFVHVLTHREMRFFPYALPWPDDAEVSLQAARYEAARFVDGSEPLSLGLASWVSALLGRLSAAAASTT
jgi:A/G-specific adenine glycosylase